MQDLFVKEENVLKEGERLLASGSFESAEDEKKYQHLLSSYRRLLQQTRRLVKLSDRMEGKLSNASNKFEELSFDAALTGIHNRRYFDAAMPREWRRALKAKASIALIMIDIDHFKNYNDTFGHPEGDVCLRLVGGVLAGALKRSADWAARYGGEEFVLCLPNTDTQGGLRIAEKIALWIAALEPTPDGSGLRRKITVSAGVAATVPDQHIPWALLVKATDEALYRAKSDGRNCIRMSETKLVASPA